MRAPSCLHLFDSSRSHVWQAAQLDSFNPAPHRHSLLSPDNPVCLRSLAASAADFVDSAGVVTHLSYTDTPYYTHFSRVLSALQRWASITSVTATTPGRLPHLSSRPISNWPPRASNATMSFHSTSQRPLSPLRVSLPKWETWNRSNRPMNATSPATAAAPPAPAASRTCCRSCPQSAPQRSV